ncbi:MAG: metal-dependent hydrolase [Candidatus Micrarchaeota archaeon]
MEYVYYMGHASFELELGGRRILIDPFFGPSIKGKPRAIPSTGSVQKIVKADFVLITHEHPDHFEKETVQDIVKRTGAVVVAPRNVLGQLNIADNRKVDIRVGDKFNLYGVEIEVTPAVHPQSEYPVGYIVSGGGARVYHAGDTYEFSKMMDIKTDWALIPIGGSFTMDPIGAVKACDEIRPKFAVPIHYNTYENINQVVAEFTTAVEASGRTKTVVMKPGDSREI